METIDLKHVLAVNLKALMDRHGLKSGYDVYRYTGVSKAQVNNLLGERHAASIDTLSRFAQKFGTPAWALIHPQGLELSDDEHIPRLINAYGEASKSGRGVILQVAESQAQYQPTSDPE